MEQKEINDAVDSAVEKANNEKKNQPIKKFVTKGGISATIWSEIKEVNGKQVEFNNIIIERQYTQDNGKNWNSTNSMRIDDLPKVALVAEQAYKYLVMKQLGN